jgi:hypothetical protein
MPIGDVTGQHDRRGLETEKRVNFGDVLRSVTSRIAQIT